MERGFLHAFLGGAPLALLACGLTADFSGLQGGAHPDASTDGDVDAVADGGPGFCASLAPTPRVCADFDEGGPVDQNWTLLDLTQGATASVDSVGYGSSRGSFLSAFDLGSSIPASARLKASTSLQATEIKIQFEMLLEPSDGSLELCVIHQTVGDVTYGLFYKEDNGGKVLTYLKTLNADGTLTEQTDIIGPPSSTWMHVEIDFALSADGSYTVKHDGAVVVRQPHIATSTNARSEMFVDLGFYAYVPNAGGGRVHFDNVVVDWL